MSEQNEIYRATVEYGALCSVPIYNDHQRAKNWMAIIAINPASPGGIDRTFVARARGQYYYHVDAALVGKPVEFGADYYTGSGNRTARRWYGVVQSLTGDVITIERYPTAREAVDAAAVAPRREALLEERATLAARIAEIDALLGGE